MEEGKNLGSSEIVKKREEWADSLSDFSVSDVCYVSKAFAIISVVFAHTSSYNNAYYEDIGALIGLVGVPVFLIVSGFFLNLEVPRRKFWSAKVKRIIIPWIIWGLITYMIKIDLRFSDFSANAILRWTIGYNTWLYYVPVMLICTAMCRVCHDRGLMVLIGISLLSWFGTYKEVILPPFLLPYVTNNMNAFNFLFLFVLGVMIRKAVDRNAAVVQWCIHFCGGGVFALTVCIGITIALGILYVWSGRWISYWGCLYSIPFELMATIVVLQLSILCRHSCLLKEIGKQTYFIYFFHMHLGMGILNRILFKYIPVNDFCEMILLVSKPILITVFSYAISRMIIYSAQKARLEKYLVYGGIMPIGEIVSK